MLVVMKLHRFGIDVRFKRGVVVGKWWQFVSQNILLDWSLIHWDESGTSLPRLGVVRLGKPLARQKRLAQRLRLIALSNIASPCYRMQLRQGGFENVDPLSRS
jgi:hypothetical protein